MTATDYRADPTYQQLRAYLDAHPGDYGAANALADRLMELDASPGVVALARLDRVPDYHPDWGWRYWCHDAHNRRAIISPDWWRGWADYDFPTREQAEDAA